MSVALDRLLMNAGFYKDADGDWRHREVIGLQISPDQVTVANLHTLRQLVGLRQFVAFANSSYAPMRDQLATPAQTFPPNEQEHSP